MKPEIKLSKEKLFQFQIESREHVSNKEWFSYQKNSHPKILKHQVIVYFKFFVLKTISHSLFSTILLNINCLLAIILAFKGSYRKYYQTLVEPCSLTLDKNDFSNVVSASLNGVKILGDNCNGILEVMT